MEIEKHPNFCLFQASQGCKTRRFLKYLTSPNTYCNYHAVNEPDSLKLFLNYYICVQPWKRFQMVITALGNFDGAKGGAIAKDTFKYRERTPFHE